MFILNPKNCGTFDEVKDHNMMKNENMIILRFRFEHILEPVKFPDAPNDLDISET